MKTWTTNPEQLLDKAASPLKQACRSLNNPYANPLTTALGWVSIGLGLAEILAPRQLSDAMGVRNHPTLMRALGLREISAGVGLFASRQPSHWLWARAAGDVMDLALLGAAFRTDKRDGTRLSSATAMIAAVAVLDVFAALKQGDEERQ
ncbi:MAG: cyclase/dehydrase [Burkholderia sp.]|nr:cyclase/dehydrase [Burkholderia sp.]